MPTQFQKEQLPRCITAARAALGPLIVVGQAFHWSAATLVALILTGLLTDIFDGILARRWHCDTPAGSLFDSMADTVFYAGVALALWIAHPELFRSNWPLLATLAALEAARFAFDFAKFGKPASYHSYCAKAWGLLLASALIAEFATGRASTLITAAIAWGILCDLEGLAMSLILPAWLNEVKTLRTALNLRRLLLSTTLSPALASPATEASAPALSDAISS